MLRKIGTGLTKKAKNAYFYTKVSLFPFILMNLNLLHGRSSVTILTYLCGRAWRTTRLDRTPNCYIGQRKNIVCGKCELPVIYRVYLSVKPSFLGDLCVSARYCWQCFSCRWVFFFVLHPGHPVGPGMQFPACLSVSPGAIGR